MGIFSSSLIPILQVMKPKHGSVLFMNSYGEKDVQLQECKEKTEYVNVHAYID